MADNESLDRRCREGPTEDGLTPEAQESLNRFRAEFAAQGKDVPPSWSCTARRIQRGKSAGLLAYTYTSPSNVRFPSRKLAWQACGLRGHQPGPRSTVTDTGSPAKRAKIAGEAKPNSPQAPMKPQTLTKDGSDILPQMRRQLKLTSSQLAAANNKAEKYNRLYDKKRLQLQTAQGPSALAAPTAIAEACNFAEDVADGETVPTLLQPK